MNSVSSVPPFVEALVFQAQDWGGLNSDSTEVADRRKLRGLLDLSVHVDPVEERVELYKSLNDLLSSGTNDRFALYCPMYLVPHVDWYRQYGESVDSFTELYLDSWFRLLRVHDVRANFIDGDVPDIEQAESDLWMTVQAARLAPVLEDKGLINRKQLPSDDPVLTRSLEDAFLRLQVTSEYIFNHSKPLNESVAAGLYFQTPASPVSEKRAKWLKWEHHRKSISYMANTIGHWIRCGDTFGYSKDLDVNTAEVILLGIGSAIEETWKHGESMEPYRRFEGTLVDFLGDDRYRDAATGVFCRLYCAGFFTNSFLQSLDISYPTLEGPLFQNLSTVEEERAEFRNKLQDSELADVIYPAGIIYGSRLKGYGRHDSDLDRAVFIRPGVMGSARQLLRTKLGDVTEYWLDGAGDELRVHDFPQLMASVGDSTDAHVLFGGSWEGDTATISMLGERLLKPYFCEENEQVRQVWLEEMERDLLQYRLLHRGYERFNIAGPDIFMDDRYRLMASKLYASHVFIPRI